MSFDFNTAQANKEALARIVAALKATPRERRGYSIRDISPGDLVSDLEELIAAELDRARGPSGLDHKHLLACARGVVDHDAAQALTGPVANALLAALRSACGDSIEDVAMRVGPHSASAQSAGARRHWVTSEGYTQLPPEMCAHLGLGTEGGHVWFLPDEAGPAWKAWKEEDLGAVFGERGSDLTERVGLPREMAPTVEPDPIAALTLAAYSATLAGLDRGTSAKAGVAALMSAYTAGVERAIADYAKETR